MIKTKKSLLQLENDNGLKYIALVITIIQVSNAEYENKYNFTAVSTVDGPHDIDSYNEAPIILICLLELNGGYFFKTRYIHFKNIVLLLFSKTL